MTLAVRDPGLERAPPTGERDILLTCCHLSSSLACVDGVLGGEELNSKGSGRVLSSTEEAPARSYWANDKGERGEVPMFWTALGVEEPAGGIGVVCV